MNRFAALLDRLAYEPRRNGKLRLIADYFRHVPDPERGWALAALTGALSFRNAKAGLIRQLISERTDPVLFALSYDYVGDLSETVALMWPAPHGRNDPEAPSLSAVVHAFSTLGKTELPAVLAALLDRLGRDRALGAVEAHHREPAHRRLGAARQDRGGGAGRRWSRTRSNWSGPASSRPTPNCSPGPRAAGRARRPRTRRRSGR